MFPQAAFIDWHGVLCAQPFWHHLPEDHAYQSYARALFLDEALCARWMRGEVSAAGVLEHIVHEQDDPDDVRRELHVSVDRMVCDPGVVAALGPLRERTAHMAIATDNVDAFHGARWPTELFDAQLCSSDLGALKRDPEAFFGRHLKILGLRPEQTVLVDDRADNCAAFTAWGGHAIVFESAGQLAEAIAAL